MIEIYQILFGYFPPEAQIILILLFSIVFMVWVLKLIATVLDALPFL